MSQRRRVRVDPEISCENEHERGDRDEQRHAGRGPTLAIHRRSTHCSPSACDELVRRRSSEQVVADRAAQSDELEATPVVCESIPQCDQRADTVAIDGREVRAVEGNVFSGARDERAEFVSKCRNGSAFDVTRQGKSVQCHRASPGSQGEAAISAKQGLGRAETNVAPKRRTRTFHGTPTPQGLSTAGVESVPYAPLWIGQASSGRSGAQAEPLMCVPPPTNSVLPVM